jgi:hypothetical protein
VALLLKEHNMVTEVTMPLTLRAYPLSCNLRPYAH